MIAPAFWHDVRRALTTFAIALSTGSVCYYLNLPAPFLMGSLFGVWMIGALFKPLQPNLGVARWVHVPVVVGLGVLIGSYFTLQVLTHALGWYDTAFIMIIVTVVVTGSGYFVLTRWRGYEPLMAFFCSVPGGQAEALLLAREYIEKDYVVALFHLVRVAIVFFSTPLILAYVQGGEAVLQSNISLTAMPSLADLSLMQGLYFIAIALVGFGVALVMHWPMPHLFGPVVFSALAHIFGLVEIPRVFEFVLLAQLVIAGGVGARLASVPFASLFGYLKDACLMSIATLSLYFAAAFGLSIVLDIGLLQMWLAFVPGGLYEVTLLALLFGFDIAFVAFHHTLRIILVFVSMPLVTTALRRPK